MSTVERGRTNRLLRRRDVNASTKLVWLWLVGHHAPQVGDAHAISISLLARDLGLHRRTIWRTLAVLHDSGQIDWQRVGGGRHNDLGTITICREPRPQQRPRGLEGRTPTRTGSWPQAERAGRRSA